MQLQHRCSHPNGLWVSAITSGQHALSSHMWPLKGSTEQADSELLSRCPPRLAATYSHQDVRVFGLSGLDRHRTALFSKTARLQGSCQGDLLKVVMHCRCLNCHSQSVSGRITRISDTMDHGKRLILPLCQQPIQAEIASVHFACLGSIANPGKVPDVSKCGQVELILNRQLHMVTGVRHGMPQV